MEIGCKLSKQSNAKVFGSDGSPVFFQKQMAFQSHASAVGGCSSQNCLVRKKLKNFEKST